MINSSLGSLESAVCKTPHIIKHSGRYSNFHLIMIKTCDLTNWRFFFTMVQSKFWISFIYTSYSGPTIPWILLGLVKIKIRACKLGSENTSWIRKYLKYDEMNRKIRNWTLHRMQKTRWKYIKYYVRDNKVCGTSGIAKKDF